MGNLCLLAKKMENFERVPQGATETVTFRDDKAVLKARGSGGWRKPTPELLQAERFAEVGEQLTIPKARAIVATKKVAAAIGLKSQDLLLLDTFGAVTQPQDWERGRRPIVWASNHFLMEQTGFSLATLRRHMRRLCEVGVMSMKDSPNGKRWGRRDANGVIVEAYGFDLAPMAARTEEFEALYEHLKAERAHCTSLRNAITVTRRMIRAKIEKALATGLRGPWENLRAGGLESYQDRIKAFQASVEQSFEAAFDWRSESDVRAVTNIIDDQINSVNMTPTSFENETHILTTNEPNPVISNRFETKHAAGVTSEKTTVEPGERAENVDLDISWSTHTNKRSSWRVEPKGI